jgi:hypothetical protein
MRRRQNYSTYKKDISHNRYILQQPIMDAAIDLSDAKKALDLSNIRFQLMYVPPTTVSFPTC